MHRRVGDRLAPTHVRASTRRGDESEEGRVGVEGLGDDHDHPP
jgi:hypothetical protein